jgi:hypothetical protein
MAAPTGQCSTAPGLAVDALLGRGGSGVVVKVDLPSNMCTFTGWRNQSTGVPEPRTRVSSGLVPATAW